ncbi:MAG: hypothetical protein ABIP17_12925 [Ilumatobacteraceae bacterium]
MTMRDRGSASLTTVVLTPVAIAVALAAFQAALWTHARTEARAIARDAAVLVARSGEPEGAVLASSERLLDEQQSLTDAVMEIDASGPSLVVVTVDGTAPGIFRWTERPFVVVEVVPREGFRP